MIYWRPIPYYVLWSITLEQSPMFKLMFQLLHSLSWLSLYIMCISLDITELLGIKWVSILVFLNYFAVNIVLLNMLNTCVK